MQGFGDQVDEFISVYRKDFPKKTCEIPKSMKVDSDYTDIIARIYKDYLLPDYKFSDLQEPTEFERAGDFYKKLVSEVPKLKRHIEQEVDQEYIKEKYQNEGCSIYQIDYCTGNGILSKRALKEQRIELPKDWGEPPITTQRKSYRDPRKILQKGESIVTKAFKEPKSEQVQSSQIKEILQIRTGESEYQSVIGLLGDQIVSDHYHGKIQLLPNEFVPQE